MPQGSEPSEKVCVYCTSARISQRVETCTNTHKTPTQRQQTTCPMSGHYYREKYPPQTCLCNRFEQHANSLSHWRTWPPMASAVQTQASKPHIHTQSSSPHNTDVWSWYLLTANAHVHTLCACKQNLNVWRIFIQHSRTIWHYDKHSYTNIKQYFHAVNPGAVVAKESRTLNWIFYKNYKIPGEFVKNADRFQMHSRGDTYSNMLPHTLIYV